MNDKFFIGVIVEAGNDPEDGTPRVVIETTEQQLKALKMNPCYRQCRVEVIEIIPAEESADAP